MKAIFIGAAAAFAFGSAASAQTTAYKATPRAEGDPNKLICEKVEQIGSRLGARKVCLTAEQWKEKHREHSQFTEEIQSGTYGPNSNDPDGAISPP